MAESLSGKVQTVLGLISPGDLGITLPHEHVSMTFEVSYRQPFPGDEEKVSLPFSMEHVGWIRQFPYSSHPNLTLLEDEAAIIEELKALKACGGGCLVENSVYGTNRNIGFVKRASEESGLHIVAGTGYYVNDAQTSTTRGHTVEALAARIREDITSGFEESDVKAGVIGEVGCSWPLTDFEKNSLQASAIVQSELGAPLIIHPGRDKASPAEVVRFLQEAGADISKTVMSHLDRTFSDEESLLEFAGLGSYLEFDLFGVEVSHFQNNEYFDMPNDARRINLIKTLLDNGYEDRVMMAMDIHTRHRLTKYGGHGFCHIQKVVRPMMKIRGISTITMDKIQIDNPKKWLTFK